MNRFTLFLTAGALLAAAAGCAGGAKTADESADRATDRPAATEQPAPESSAAAVVKLTDDQAYRPDTKVESPVVIDFNATWCGPCRQFHPVFEETAKAFAGKATFVSCDVDHNPHTAQAFDIHSIPTVVIMVPGKEPVKYVGTADIMPLDKFATALNNAGIN